MINSLPIICIYKITNIINQKYYIGSTKDYYKRIKSHQSTLKNNRHQNFKLQNSYNKHGEKSFVYEIIEICTIENLLLREQKYLDQLDYNSVYNLSDKAAGGDLLTHHPRKEDIRNKIIKSLKLIKISDEEMARRKGQVGLKNPNFGKKWNNELKEEVSLLVKERWKNYTPEKKAELIKNSTEATHKFWKSEKGTERKKMMSYKTSGKNNPFYDKKHPDHVLKIIKEKNTGKQQKTCWIAISIEGVIYSSLSEASKKLNIPMATVYYRLNSKNPIFSNWNYEGKTKMAIRRKTHNEKKYQIKDKIYNSIREATRDTQLSDTVLRFRAKSTNPKWADYSFPTEPKTQAE